MSSVLLEFCYGMLIAEAFRRKLLESVPSSAAVVLLLTGVGALTFTSPNAPMRGFLVGPAAAVVFIGALSLNRKFPNPIGWFKLLGDASYSIYLSHLLTLSASYQIWRALKLPMTPNALFLFGPLAVILSVLAGIIIYLYIELPLTQYAQKRKTKIHTAKIIDIA